MPEPEYLTGADVARLCGVSRQDVSAAMLSGKLARAIVAGRTSLYTPAAVKEWRSTLSKGGRPPKPIDNAGTEQVD